LFTDATKAKGQSTPGARNADHGTGKGEDITIVLGVNHTKYDPSKHQSSPTQVARPTALAPVVHVC